MTKGLCTAVTSLALLMTGCADHSWAPPPGVDVSAFEQQAATCRLYARNGTPQPPGGIVAYGNPRFVGTTVGAYALGSGIGTAIRTNENFNDCMAASGWHATD